MRKTIALRSIDRPHAWEILSESESKREREREKEREKERGKVNV